MNRYIVDCEAIGKNADIFHRQMATVQIIGVVKGNGYGLGTVSLAKALLKKGIKMLAVARIDEAKALRKAGIEVPILMLTPVMTEEEAACIVDMGLIGCIDSAESAVLLNSVSEQTAQITEVHIKVDTGFGRYGFLSGEEDKIIRVAKHMKNLCIGGIFTHISNPYTSDRHSIDAQMAKFKKTCERLENERINLGIKHVANTATALKYPEYRFDAVRIGSGFLGRLPIKDSWGFSRVGYFESSITQIKWVPENMNIGYADVFKTKKATKTAVVPIGHTDGFGVMKSRDTYRFRDVLRYMWGDFKDIFKDKRVFCLINGKKAPILGRIGLTNIVVDVTRIECSVGDKVVLESNPLTVGANVERVFIND